MKRNMVKQTLLLFLSTFILLIIGCSKLTIENYNKLEIGMDYEEVVEILGDADECDETLTVRKCVWGNETKYVHVSFVNKKVILFSEKGL